MQKSVAYILFRTIEFLKSWETMSDCIEPPPEGEVISSASLDKFIENVAYAAPDLAWIRAVSGHDMDDSFIAQRLKRSSDGINNILAAFNVLSFYAEEEERFPGITDEIESGDAWYNSFRSRESKNDQFNSNKLRSTKKIGKKKNKKRNKSKDKQNHSSDVNLKPSHSELKFEEANFAPLSFNPILTPMRSSSKVSNHRSDSDYQDYEFSQDQQKSEPNTLNQNPRLQWLNPNQGQRQPSTYYNPSQKYESNFYQSNTANQGPAKFSNFGRDNLRNSEQPETVELKDQIEQTKNDLSHEANYKLSKIEQDAMDKRSNISWPLHHPEYEMSLLMQSYQQPEAQLQEEKPEEKTENKAENGRQQRSLNAFNEIKLKTSNRMISKGLGASLPSDALNSRKFITIEDILADKPIPKSVRSNQYFKPNDWKRSSDNLEPQDYFSTGRRILQLPEPGSFSNRVRTKRNDRIEKSTPKDEAYVKTEESRDLVRVKLFNAAHQKQPVLRQDQNYRIRRSIAEKLPTENQVSNFETDHSDTKDTPNKNPAVDNCLTFNQPQNCNHKSFKNETYSPPSADIINEENIQPASVPKNGNETVKMKIDITINTTVNENCTKNSAMGLKNPKNVVVTREEAKDKIIEKRGIIFTHIPSLTKKQTNEDVRESLMKTNKDAPLDDLVTGKLPSQLVNAVFQYAKNNANFRTQIWPALKNRKLTTVAELRDFGAIRNENNAAQIEHTEQMLRQVMETLNTIIEQQVRSRTCIPLRPDLQLFYDQIISSRSENEKTLRTYRKRKSREHHMHASHVLKRSAVTEPKQRQKNSIVKKLLNQYDYLSPDDQDKVKEIKDFLQMHLVFLKEIEANEHKLKRRKRKVAASKSKGSDQTSKFTKLLRAAEYIRRTSSQSEDTGDYGSFLDYEYF